MARTHFYLPGLEQVVQKIVPNFNADGSPKNTVTIFCTIRGAQFQFTIPHLPGDFDNTSGKIITKIATL